MARRITPSQARSKLRQAQQRQRQAINNYNSAARKYNSERKRAIDNYNQKARAHNARVRANQQRLQREIRRLNSTTSTRYVVYRRSVVTLTHSFSRIESAAESGTWTGGDELLDLAEGEAANSIAVLRVLESEDTDDAIKQDESLAETSLTGELAELSPDLDARWRGALYALSPKNPDAARHFCTSAREVLTSILVTEAPDDAVLTANPRAGVSPNGRVTRRERIRHCLGKQGSDDANLVAFVDDDIDNVVTLFDEFNRGTHGQAGKFDLTHLTAIKARFEDAVRFLYRIVR